MGTFLYFADKDKTRHRLWKEGKNSPVKDKFVHLKYFGDKK